MYQRKTKVNNYSYDFNLKSKDNKLITPIKRKYYYYYLYIKTI